MTPFAKRVLIGLGAVALVVPAVISVGAIAFSFVPGLRVGVQPLTLFMAAADGIAGIFFFVFFFGAPIAAIVGGLLYGTLLALHPGGSVIPRRWAAASGGLVGAILLPPAWSLGTTPPGVERYLGPAVLGAIAGASAGVVFWYLVIRERGAAAV